ncbi:MAG: PspA/IM30 family protein [Isosphaeraceae bacterium]
MRLFRRIGDIIAANLNEWVDRFEDPEVMLKQALREMETMIEGATAGAARAIAGERLLAKELADHERKARVWNTRAEEAVIRGDDDLARQAIARAHEHESMARALVDQRSAAERTAQVLRGQIDAMRAKHAEARRKLASLSARRQAAETGRALRGMARESACGTNGFARFDRMQHQIERAEAEAEALGELYESDAPSLEAEAESRERARHVEDELAAIKERLRK